MHQVKVVTESHHLGLSSVVTQLLYTYHIPIKHHGRAVCGYSQSLGLPTYP